MGQQDTEVLHYTVSGTMAPPRQLPNPTLVRSCVIDVDLVDYH